MALFGVALAADFFRGAPFHFGPGQLAVALLGLTLIIAGALLWRSPRFAGWLESLVRRGVSGWTMGAAWIVAAVVGLVVVELLARVVAGETLITIRHDATWRRVPYYAEQEWAELYWQEFERLEFVYRPFLLWGTAPFAGQWTRVDGESIRYTPGAATTEDRWRVFTFGGSAMWGTGAPDHGTIPAELQRRLAARLEHPVEVVNLAEKGYVSTQNLLRLMLELRAGRIPELVVFYDGYNETGVAVVDEPGGHFELQKITGRLQQPVRAWLSTLRIVRVMQGWLSPRPGLDHLADESQRGQVAEEIVGSYLGNYRAVEALAEEYGFSFVFFWQPALMASAKPRAPGEERIAAGALPELTSLLRRVYDRIDDEAGVRAHLESLTAVLDQENAHLYVDEVHLTPQGNELVAAAMTDFLVSRLEQPEPTKTAETSP